MLVTWQLRDWLTYLSKHSQDMHRQATFVQVGANDGQTNDPLFASMQKNPGLWVGVLAEPVSFAIKRLRKLHADKSSWSIVQAAVTDRCNSSHITFWEFPQTQTAAEFDATPRTKRNLSIPRYIQIGQGNGLSQIQDWLKPKSVPCIDDVTDGLIQRHSSSPFKRALQANRLEQHGPAHLDLLQVDCETHDWRVIHALNFDLVRPRVVHFEGYGPAEIAIKKLVDAGYMIRKVDRMNYLAVDVSFVLLSIGAGPKSRLRSQLRGAGLSRRRSIQCLRHRGGRWRWVND